MAVAIERSRDAGPHDHPAQQGHVARRILRFLEKRCGDLASGIVDDSEQGHARQLRAEPGVMAGIYLEQHSFLGIAFSPGAMPGPPALWAWRRQASLAEDAAERLP